MEIINKQIFSQDLTELGRIDLIRSLNFDGFTEELEINNKKTSEYDLYLRVGDLPKMFIECDWINDNKLKVDIRVENEGGRVILDTTLEINNIDKSIPEPRLKKMISSQVYDYVHDSIY